MSTTVLATVREAFLLPATVLFTVYVRYVIEHYKLPRGRFFYPITTGMASAAAVFLTLGDLRAFDDFYADFDEAIGGKWNESRPTTEL